MEGNQTELDQIKEVIYTLHYTFPKPVRIINTRQNNFRLDAMGWGTFTIYIRINLLNSAYVELEHELELYYPVEEENPEEIKVVAGISEEYNRLQEEIDGMWRKLASSELQEERSSIERNLMNKISEWEQLRSDMNNVIQIFKGNKEPVNEDKIKEARAYFDKVDFRSANLAPE